MNNLRQRFKFKSMIICLVASSLIALSIQIILFPNKINLYSNAEFYSINSKMNIINYDVNDNNFTAKNNDPQLLFQDINSNISALEIRFVKPIEEDIPIQIYFSRGNENLSEKNSILYNAKKGNEKVTVEIPYNNYSVIRVDIGNRLGQRFELSKIKICKLKINLWEKVIAKIRILNLAVLFFLIFIILNIFGEYKSKILSRENKILEIVFIIFCFIMFLIWAIVQPFDSCPDEQMRYNVIRYIFDHNKLPHGGDPLIRDSQWGFSYAFLPYLSGIVSVIFMKSVSIFTVNPQAIILAARMSTVFFGALTVYYVIKISNKCFKDQYKWLFIVLVCCLPQFVFLGSYMNNDMAALTGVVIMLYYWIEGHEQNWNIKSNIGLAIGISISLLSYYNVYTFVLFSIIFFIWSNINNDIDKREILKKFILVTIVVFILSGWWFIRNAIIYDGDFLAMNTIRKYSNMYAVDNLKLINRMTPAKKGYSLLFMLFDMKWIQTTCLSFIGIFGYLTIKLNNWMYNFYKTIIAIGMVGFGISILNLKKRKNCNFIFYVCMTLAGGGTILLSIYNSYKSDFQPQGRYIMAFLIPLMMLTTIGFRYLFDFIENKLQISTKKLVYALCIFYILMSIACLTRIVIPIYS